MNDRTDRASFDGTSGSPGGGLSLEALTPAHAEEMAVALADPRLYTHIGGRPPSAAELRGRYARLQQGSDEPGVHWLNWVIRLDDDGTAVGFVQATVGPGAGGRSAVVAWMVGTPWQRRGIATRATRALVSRLRERGVRPIEAHIHPANLASEMVAEACGLHRTDRHSDGELIWTDAE